jgi:hypothetical protein
MVDDTPGKLARQYGNYIRVTPYLGNEDDRELALLTRYLRELRDVENVRRIEKRGWHPRVSLQLAAESDADGRGNPSNPRSSHTIYSL